MTVKSPGNQPGRFEAAPKEVAHIHRRTAPGAAAGQSHSAVLRGRVVQTRGQGKPYKVIMEHAGGASTEHPVNTMAEGEALIRRETPRPPRKDRTRDRPAD